MKLCTLCGELQPFENYSKDKSKKDGLYPRCKKCKSKNDADYRSNNMVKKREIDKQYYLQNSETIRQRARDWYIDNKDRHKVTSKCYYENNKEHLQVKKQEWNSRNKEKMKVYMNTYIKDKYLNDIQYKTKAVLCSRMRKFIKSKNGRTMDIVGCSVEFFMEWIEFQFTPSMNWDNHGSYWHLDHVRPCKDFDFTIDQDILQCFHWKNVRPLEASANISKGCRFTKELLDKHELIVNEFITRRTKGYMNILAEKENSDKVITSA
jgi:hypothetical protein